MSPDNLQSIEIFTVSVPAGAGTSCEFFLTRALAERFVTRNSHGSRVPRVFPVTVMRRLPDFGGFKYFRLDPIDVSETEPDKRILCRESIDAMVRANFPSWNVSDQSRMSAAMARLAMAIDSARLDDLHDLHNQVPGIS